VPPVYAKIFGFKYKTVWHDKRSFPIHVYKIIKFWSEMKQFIKCNKLISNYEWDIYEISLHSTNLKIFENLMFRIVTILSLSVSLPLSLSLSLSHIISHNTHTQSLHLVHFDPHFKIWLIMMFSNYSRVAKLCSAKDLIWFSSNRSCLNCYFWIGQDQEL